MGKFIAAVALCSLSLMAFAHEDQILPIQPDGTLKDLPASFGRVRVEIDRSAKDPDAVTGVWLVGPRFSVRLSPCVISKLSHVTKVQASGSWYHDLHRFPPYVSLTFFSDCPGAKSSDFYAVTFSLLDGHILAGERAWDPWWGSWRGKVIDPADKCSHWQELSLWPNNSFKPNPLRGSA